MRKTLTLSLLLLISLSVSANSGLKANLSLCSFWSPQDGPFLETYLSVNAATLQLVSAEGGFTGSAEVIMIFKQGERIADFRKYELRSPLITDTLNIGINFIDQQRFLLDSGDYVFEISIRDLHGK
ncbi:MAG TPA: hypothetical protein P5248_05835, partial [Bacteroidales bacterium]|nr:hypothetical protein [Bacteroidales bacterium]